MATFEYATGGDDADTRRRLMDRVEARVVGQGSCVHGGAPIRHRRRSHPRPRARRWAVSFHEINVASGPVISSTPFEAILALSRRNCPVERPRARQAMVSRTKLW